MSKLVIYVLLSFLGSLSVFSLETAHAETQCAVADPTGTPLNVRTAPYGKIINALQNGNSVGIIDRATDRYGKRWVYIADQGGHPLGWVFQDYILCSVTSQSEAAAPERSKYLQLNCHMDECFWSAIQSKLIISTNANGSLIGATANECSTTHRNGEYPKRYTCRASETSVTQWVAFCSSRFPSIAVKHDDKWLRTKLSISDDGEFGFNISDITMYLQICHDYVRGTESLDMIAAKFGYKSRQKQLADIDVQDTVDEIPKLAE
jgi:hypothetical protein